MDEGAASAAFINTEEEGEDEGVPNWKDFAKFAKSASTSKTGDVPFIPRRGDKDFTPLEGRAASQHAALTESRNAMFAALTAGQSRQHSSRSHNKAVWHQELRRASMNVQDTHGIHFNSLGQYNSLRSRIELLPEEALYMVERGSLECWTQEDVAMSAQQAFSCMLEKGDLTIDKYQVYASLKRLGYSVLRANNTTSEELHTPSSSFERLTRILKTHLLYPLRLLVRHLQYFVAKTRICDSPQATFARLGRMHRRSLRPSSPRMTSLLSDTRWRNYDQAFSSLQIIPAGRTKSDYIAKPLPHNEPYQIFWHVYKPTTKFKKSAPPPPDFYVAVVNAVKTDMPTQSQLQGLFARLPYNASPPQKKPEEPATWYTRLIAILSKPKHAKRPARPPTPYARLKTGERTVVIAVNDAGTQSYFRFSSTDFSAHSWMGIGKIS